jgi:hypothetical protein
MTIFWSVRFTEMQVSEVTPGMRFDALISPTVNMILCTGIENMVINLACEITFKFLLGGTDEHVPHEEGVVNSRAQNSNLDTVLWVPSSVAIDYVESRASVQVV